MTSQSFLGLSFFILVQFLGLARAGDCLESLKKGWHKMRKVDFQKAKLPVVYYAKEGSYFKLGQAEFLLANDPSSLPVSCGKVPIIKAPVLRVSALSTTHLPYFDLLARKKHLVSVGSANLISALWVRDRIKSGQVSEVGLPPHAEALILNKPDIVFSDWPYEATQKKVAAFGITLVPLLEYKEEHPLARAEWIKVVGAMLHSLPAAEERYNDIMKRYLAIQKKARSQKKPKVLVGSLEGGIWYAPGPTSDLAQLISDAGGEYVFAQEEGGRERLAFNFEAILSLVKDVDIWLPQANWKDPKDALEASPLHKHLLSLKTFLNTAKWYENGGNDYWETAMARPDLLLQDLATIFKREQKKLEWFKKMENDQ